MAQVTRVNSPKTEVHSQCKKGGQPALPPGLEKTCLEGSPQLDYGWKEPGADAVQCLPHSELCPVWNGQPPFRGLWTR